MKTRLLSLEFTKLQELVYNLPIENVMKKNVISVRPDTTIKQLKGILRINRISGVPVLDGDRLVGIVSTEDLIKAIENGELNCPVGEKMTTQLITVLETASIIEAIRKFYQFGVGRLLVVNEQGTLTGVLTASDITKGLLEVVSRKYQDHEVKRKPQLVFKEDIVSDQTSLILRYRIKERDFKNGGSASSKIKKALEHLGISPQVLRRVAISAYEAEMNLIIHTDAGGELITEIQPDLIRMTVIDHGPGIPDVEQALCPGFSTAPEGVRELGFGAGMGLANIKKCADSFVIESSPGTGTTLNIIIYL
jgi:CBS domain-containing protein/anti-sigma regulatory factor (Ser/Thr protein kinase)